MNRQTRIFVSLSSLLLFIILGSIFGVIISAPLPIEAQSGKQSFSEIIVKKLTVLYGGSTFNSDAAFNDDVTITGDLTGVDSFLDTIQLDTDLAAPGYNEGLLYWDDASATLAIMSDVDGVTLQTGQEQYVKVRNATGATIANGTPVNIAGALGNRALITPARADTITNSYVIGLATSDIENNQNSYVTTFGLVRDLNTSDFSEGDAIYLASTAYGVLTNTVPITGYESFVGVVIYAHNTQGIILVNPAIHGIVGDISGGNYFETLSDGTVQLHGTATAWDDLRISASSTKLGGSKDPTFAKWTDDGAGSQGIFTYLFDPTNEEELYFAAQLPHGWKEGTNIGPHLHWFPTADGNPGEYVQWGLECIWENLSTVITNTTIITVNTTYQGDTTLLDNKHYLSDFQEMDGTGKTLSSMIVCRGFRDAANDTYGADVGLLEFDFHYEVDSFGSSTEYSD